MKKKRYTSKFPGSMSVSSSIQLNRRIIGWTGPGELNQGLETGEGEYFQYFPSLLSSNQTKKLISVF